MIQFVSEYLTHLSARGLSEGYIQQVSCQLRLFFNSLSNEQAHHAVTREEVACYAHSLETTARNLRGNALRARLIQRRLQALKQFFTYLKRTKRILLNPARDLVLPKPDRLPSDVPTHRELVALIDSIPEEAYGTRDKAILELLYSSGVRAAELINLNLYDLDFEGGRVLIRSGKGHKDRVVPLGAKAGKALQAYLTELRPKLLRRGATAALFISRRSRRITYAVLNRLIRTYRQEAKIRPHSIRHACALGMLRGGADIRFIQELLGHARLESTQIYTRLYPSEVKAAHTRFHPRLRLRSGGQARHFSPSEVKEKAFKANA